MAGTFEGLSDLEWKLFADLFPPEPTKRGRDMVLSQVFFWDVFGV